MTDSIEELMLYHQKAMAEEANRQLAAASDLIEKFTLYANKKGARLDARSFAYVPTIGIVAAALGLVRVVLGKGPTERDGLFSAKDLAVDHEINKFLPGYYSSQNYMLMAHPFFRRGMHEQSNFAPNFIDLFWSFEQDGVDKYVAIDEDRLRINVDESCYFEKDTWYGAPFDKEIANIQVGIGKLRPPGDLKESYIDFFFANANCLDFKWSQQGQIKTFQALELKSESVQLVHGGETYFPGRYVHAEFDLSKGVFRHFDGAVQLFREDEYIKRRVSDFNVNAKYLSHLKARSKKLFKLNGEISVNTWVELCCHFFAGNPLIFEYFTGQYPDYVVDTLNKLRARDEGAA